MAALVLLVALVIHPGPLYAQTVDTAPGNLQATVIAGGVELSWSAPADYASVVNGYQVLRSTSGQSSLRVYVTDTGSTDTTYIDKGAAEQGEIYTYQVRAKVGWRTLIGDLSNVAAVTIPGTCPISGGSPVDVPVSEVPIVVTSTTADYFVLYVRHEKGGETIEYPVLVKRGEAGTTTLEDNLAPLPASRYKVKKYPVNNPADIDGDCIDDLTELADVGTKNPVNPAEPIDISNGAVSIADHATFQKISYQGHRVNPIERHLVNMEYIKFTILHPGSDRPTVYFQNTDRLRGHFKLPEALGFSTAQSPWKGGLRGDIIYHPNVVAPDGSLGVYRYNFQVWEAPAFDSVALAYEALAAAMPVVENNLAYHPLRIAMPRYRAEKALYDASRVNVLLEEDIFPDVDFIPLNEGEGYGLLREMELEERPNSRDIVIYETLPNDLPRVAGIITGVPQTPLSHVNLRAVQNGVPNAFIRAPLDDAAIDDLLDRHVYYRVTQSGYTLRAATRAEVDAHYDASRSASAQTPERDLSVTKITPLSEIGFDDWDAFGVKAANMAALGTLGFPEGTVRDGFAVPFYFYDEFMKNAGLAEETVFGKGKGAAEDRFTLPAGTKLNAVVTAILAHPKFRTDYEIQDEMLDDLRDAIKDARSPAWIITALEAMHAKFPEGTSLRYRSSTNNEDLPGFNGAGLYSSKTQDPDETAEEGIDKSIKGVWASLWNFRAFAERDFHRIDHTRTAMGVLVHPNYSLEKANGVAISFDPVTNRDGAYYVNTQLGEDLITNPEAHSRPEEILLLPGGRQEVLARSNLAEPGKLLMSDAQMKQLRSHLEVIHKKFSELYGAAEGEPFAMDIEFKITSLGKLSIKQARPWVFQPRENQPPTVSAAVADATIVNESGTSTVSLSGAFSDADGDALTITASSSDESVATVSVSADYSNLTVAAQSRGTATITVTAEDGRGGAVSDETTVRVKAAPIVASPLADVSELGVEATHEVSLSEVFSDPDGDTVTVTEASSSDSGVAGVLAAIDGSTAAITAITVIARSEGTTTVTVTAQDSDGNSVSDAFEVSVAWAEPPEGPEPWNIWVVPGDGALTVTWNVGSRDGVDDSEIWHVLRWSQESGVWANPRDPRAVGRNDGVSVDPGLTSYTITGLENGVATGVFIRSMVGHRNNMSEREGNSSEWVRVKGEHTTPVAPPNDAPTVSAAVADATITNESGTHEVSLAGVFSDADGDVLTVTASSSDEYVARVSVSADYSTLTATARNRGTATVTVTASDGNGGEVSVTFSVTVKAAPVVASPIADISGLEADDSRTISMSGVFSDADGDVLTVTASSSDEYVATVSVSADHSTLTATARNRGTATVTVTASDGNGGEVSDTFSVTV
ncbi:MAG: Ig-like domain-containing protein, partial [Acidimicrobiia bacterium]|nr:Ig-like domain-containing protein [Acidimicrobiia bacterium]